MKKGVLCATNIFLRKLSSQILHERRLFGDVEKFIYLLLLFTVACSIQS